MSDNRNKVLLYRTNTKDAVASKESLQYGEVAMNYNAETPFLMFKDSEDEIRKIGVVVNELGNSEINSISQKAVTDAFNLPKDYVAVEYPEVSDVNFIQTTASTHLYDSIKQVDQNVATLVQEVLNNEIVTAAALTQHNDSAGFDINGKYVPHTNSKVLSGASSLDQADALLDNEISAINSKLDGTYIDGDTIYIKGESVDISDLQVKPSISENYEKTTYPSEEYKQVEVNDSLDNVAKKLEENIVTLHGDITEEIGKINKSITDLNASSLKNINVNGIKGTVTDNVAELTIDGGDVKISSDYKSVSYKLINGEEMFIPVNAEDTVDASVKKLDSNISKLVDEVIDNEIVTAAALTKHNNSAGFDENAEYVVNNSANYINAATNLATADNLLDSALFEVSSDVSDLENNFNDLVNRVNQIEIKAKEGDEIHNLNVVDGAAANQENYTNLKAAIEGGMYITVNGQTVDSHISSDDNITLYTSKSVEGEDGINTICKVYSIASDGTITSTETSSPILVNNGNGDKYLADDGTYKEVQHKLTSEYVSVEYNEKVTHIFTPAKANQTLDEAINVVEGNVAQLVQEVLDNEEVTAAALSQHNDSAGFDINGKYIKNPNANYIANATTLSNADNILDSVIADLSSTTNSILESLDEKLQPINTDITNIKNNITNINNNIDGIESSLSGFQMTVNGVQSDLGSLQPNVTVSGHNIPLSDNYVSVVYPTMTEEIFTPVVKEMNAEQAINHLDGSIAQLVQEVLDDEKVVAAAISQLNLSAGFDENALYIQNTENAIIGNASSLNEADLMLAESIETLSNSIPKKVSELTNDKFIESVTVNGILAEGSETDEHNVSVTVNADNIYLGEYGNVIVYPDVDSTEFVPVDSTMNVKSAIKQLDSTIAQLVQEILNNEEVVSAALTVHNTSCGLTLNGEYNLNTEANYISGATSLHDADLILDAKVADIFTKLTDIETRLTNIESRLTALEGTGNA